MFFESLRAKQKERSKVVARFIVDRGKRRFFISTALITGVLFWLGMNAFFLTRDRAAFRGRFVAGSEVVILLIGIFLGFMISLRMWRVYTRLAKSE
jgi:hypothetical protein